MSTGDPCLPHSTTPVPPPSVNRGLLVGLGPLGLRYILRTGGMGYFKKGVVAQHIEAGDSKPSKARRNHLSAYAVYPEASEGDLTFRKRCAA